MDNMSLYMAISILWMDIGTFTNVFVFGSLEPGQGTYMYYNFHNKLKVLDIVLLEIS